MNTIPINTFIIVAAVIIVALAAIGWAVMQRRRSLKLRQRFGPAAQILSPPRGDRERRNYFADLPVDLQNVLRAQLRQPGDVSAVIETPGGFLLYLAREKTTEVLIAAGLSVPKRGYESGLAEQ